MHDGILGLAYHGWEFDVSGKLVVILCVSSQSLVMRIVAQGGRIDKKAEQIASNNSRATSWRLVLRCSKVWVWAACSPQVI